MNWMDELACELPDNLPFDHAGPPIRRVITQAGYGGPIVGRSNPIGFIFDAIRGFCMPAAMRDDGNGGFEDLSGIGASSPDLALPAEDQGFGFGVFPGGGGTGGFGSQGGGVPAERSSSPGAGLDVSGPSALLPRPDVMGMEPARQCPSGSSFQPALGFCVPDILTGTMQGMMPTPTAFAPGGGGSGSCDRGPRGQARARLRQAVASCDRAGAEQVLAYAQGCTSEKRSGSSGSDTRRLVREAQRAIQDIDRMCRMGAQAQSQMAPDMSLGLGGRRPGVPRMAPSMPSALSLTEGNARMRSVREPMAGSVDPSAVEPMRRSGRRPGLGQRRRG